MKVVIRATGEIKDVSDGYARNYLLPRKLAAIATAFEITHVQERHQRYTTTQQQQQALYQKVTDTLRTARLDFAVAANEQGTLFAALSPLQVAQRIAADYHCATKAAQVQFDPIKTIGQYTATVAYPGVDPVQFQIEVTKATV